MDEGEEATTRGPQTGTEVRGDGLHGVGARAVLVAVDGGYPWVV